MAKRKTIRIGLLLTGYLLCQGVLCVLFPGHKAIATFFNGLLFLAFSLWLYSKNRDTATSSYNLDVIIYDLFKSISDHETPENIYQLILESAVRAVPSAEKGSIVRYEGDTMTFVANFNYDSSYLDQLHVRTKDSIFYRNTDGAMDHGVIISDLLEETLRSSHADDLRGNGFCSMCAPVILGGKTVASIHLDNHRSVSFTREDLKILEIFAYEASNILNLYESIDVLQRLAERDVLTSAYNRRFGDQVIHRLLLEETPFLLIMMDLNSLKQINDQFGHPMGDRYITLFSDTVKKLIPPKTTFIRYGGDEFLLILPSENASYGELLMQDILEQLANIPSAEIPLPLSFSYGMVSIPEESTCPDQIIMVADKRMYQYKQLIKGQMYFDGFDNE